MTAPRSAASTIPAYATAAEHLAEHLARARAILGDRGNDATEAILASDAAMAARARTTGGTPLRALLERAGLDDDALHVLVLAALPSLDGVLGARLQSRIRAACRRSASSSICSRCGRTTTRRCLPRSRRTRRCARMA